MANSVSKENNHFFSLPFLDINRALSETEKGLYLYLILSVLSVS